MNYNGLTQQDDLAGVKIVLATPDDAEGIVVLQHETWLDTYPNAEHGITREDIAEKFTDKLKLVQHRRERLESGNGVVNWVARDSGRVVGWAGASKGNTNALLALYVHPEYQGKKIGAKLMQTALDWLGSENDVTVGVAAYNIKAINFYKRWGFVEYGEADSDGRALPSGKKIPEIKMIKKFG